MNSMELMKDGRRSLVARLNDDGSVFEYVVCSYYDGKQWTWGHYFGNDLTAAVNYINDPEEEELARRIAYYCYFEGTGRTLSGNYTFHIASLEQRFGVSIDKNLRNAIMRELFSHEYVLEVWGEEETGEDVIDITFSTIFTEVDE